ncbi:MAG: Nif11-like leader peptide family natural product precursor [Cyanobacteria bacterium J06635_15]
MFNQIKALLSDSQLQQQIMKSANPTESIKLIVKAGVAKGYNFSKESVSQVLTTLTMQPNELTEEDLLAVSGGSCGPRTCELSSKVYVEN